MGGTKNKAGQLHSFDDKPTFCWGDYDKEWYKDGNLHRDNGPASIRMYYGGVLIYSYYKEGNLHRLLNPAYITVRNGIKSYEEYYIKGKLHNPIGPARIWYPPRNIFDRRFYLNGNELFFDDFIKQLEGRLGL